MKIFFHRLLFCEFCVLIVKRELTNWKILREIPKYGIVYSKTAPVDWRGLSRTGCCIIGAESGNTLFGKQGKIPAERIK